MAKKGIMKALRENKEVSFSDQEGLHVFSLGPNNKSGTHFEYYETIYHQDGRKTFWLHSNKGRESRKFGPDGYDGEGFNRRNFNREGINRQTNTKFNPLGKDMEGYNRAGFKNGLDRFGFREDLTHSETNTPFDPAGFNFYGVNSQGLTRDGKVDNDVAVLEDFIETKVSTIAKYARDYNLDPETTKAQVAAGLKKAPWLEEQYHQVASKGLSQLRSIILREAREVNDEETLKEFWARHPRLDLTCNILSERNVTSFTNIISDIVERSTLDIKFLIRCFCTSKYGLSEALTNLDNVRKKSSVKEARKELYKIEKYMKSFSAKKLYPGHYTLDGEKFVDLTEEDIKRGEEELLKNKQYVCAKTVKAYLVSRG